MHLLADEDRIAKALMYVIRDFTDGDKTVGDI